MKKLVGVVLLLLLAGCVTHTILREVTCEVECTDCKKVVHSCTYDTDKEQVEVTGT